MLSTEDPYLVAFVSLLQETMGKDAWQIRKNNIINNIEENLSRLNHRRLYHTYKQFYTGTDVLGFNLFLVESFLENNFGQSPRDAARYGLFFTKIGERLGNLKEISGWQDKLKQLVDDNASTIDAICFEILIASLWKSQGWNVEFLKPTARLSPDLKATKGNQTYFIECKKMLPKCSYTEREENHWDRIFTAVDKFLHTSKLNLILIIDFKKELETFSDDYVSSILYDLYKRKLLATDYKYSDDLITIQIKRLDLDPIHKHLKKFLVKYPSDQIERMIFGENDRTYNLIGILDARLKAPKKYPGNDLFVDRVFSCSGVAWRSVSETAIDFKSKHVRKQLSEASKQLSESENGIIHIGVENQFGPEIETIRNLKNIHNIKDFRFENDNIKTVFLHYFQSYSPPDKPWVIDETVEYFSMNEEISLSHYNCISSANEIIEGRHWDRPLPT